MKRKIRCIYIEGMDRTGKTSLARELRRHLKKQGKDLVEFNGIDNAKMDQQEVVLNENTDSFVLKQNGMLTLFYEESKEFRGIKYITEHDNKYEELVRKEMCINHDYGSALFFLIPNDINVVKNMFGEEDVPSEYPSLIEFWKKINQTSLSRGWDINLIFINEEDRIYDVRDRVLKILEEKYTI
jgi:tRNA uridine 5-carbamoylmethylation protein Kti12